jgi:hypothetical protein
VDISATVEQKVAAVAAHASQVEFLVEDILAQARLAGVDLQGRLGAAAADPAAAIAWAIRQEAAAVGQRAGVAFGEAFRYVRFHPFVESLLAQSAG